MATTVELPQLGNTVEECLVTRWLKRKGDVVVTGDVVAEIETDKTTFEITAPIDGTVLETFVDEGALVPVFTKLFVIGEAGESVEPGWSGEPAQSAFARLELARATADKPALPGPPDLPARRAGVSPRAQKFAAQHNIDTSSIVGSGPGGRVLEQDARIILQESDPRPPASVPMPSNTISATRATIARRMRESLASTAQYTLHASADARGLLALRAQNKKSGATTEITIHDLVAFCTIQALLEAPDVNAEFIGGRIVTHADIHLGFACDTPRGLVAPVVRNANQLSIGALSERMKALAAQAVDGTIAPSDLSGATFTISNLGSLGIESFTPVLNPPQVAILGVGTIQIKAVRAEGRVDFIDSIGLSLTCDHQVIDGAPGARFLRTLKDKIETVTHA